MATMPEEALEEAGNMLVSGLRALAPGCDVYRQKIVVG
ncbi:DNA/RNA-binding domain of Phe-tRNA-synthetase-like protein [Sinorhizobium fredii]